MDNSLKVLRPADLAELLSCSRVTIWRMQKRGELPPRKKISSRCVGWTEKTIENWLESRPFADPTEEEKRQSKLESA